MVTFLSFFVWSLLPTHRRCWGLMLHLITHTHTQTDRERERARLIWMTDRPDAQTSTWQHTTLTSNRQPCPRRDSNPQSHQATGCATAGSAKWLTNYNNFNTKHNGHTKRVYAFCNLTMPISPLKHVQPSDRPSDWPVLLKHSLVLFKNSLTFTKHPMGTTLTKGKLLNKPPF